MARVPYADPGASHLKELAERIVADRGEVLHLYRMLLNSPQLAEGWLDLMTAIRQRTSLPGPVRELVIVRIALLNGAEYEAEQHVPIALREGVSAEQLQALADWERAPGLYSEAERSALALTDCMTRDIHVPDNIWSAVREHWSDRQAVELVATIASYNMVSRFLEALQIRSTDTFTEPA